MRVLTLIFICGFLSSCSLRYTKVTDHNEIQGYFAQINAFNNRVFQMKAALDIKGSGLINGLIHEQVDILVKEPKFFYWSLRSFFGTPTLVAASNGEVLTVYNFSPEADQIYQKIGLNQDKSFDFFTFPFNPHKFVPLFLARIPLEDLIKPQIKTYEEKLKIFGCLTGGWYFTAIFDRALNRVLEMELNQTNRSLKYKMVYLDFKKKQGIFFPQRMVFSAKSGSRFIKLNIDLSNVELNGEAIMDDVFYLKPNF